MGACTLGFWGLRLWVLGFRVPWGLQGVRLGGFLGFGQRHS